MKWKDLVPSSFYRARTKAGDRGTEQNKTQATEKDKPVNKLHKFYKRLSINSTLGTEKCTQHTKTEYATIDDQWGSRIFESTNNEKYKSQKYGSTFVKQDYFFQILDASNSESGEYQTIENNHDHEAKNPPLVHPPGVGVPVNNLLRRQRSGIKTNPWLPSPKTRPVTFPYASAEFSPVRSRSLKVSPQTLQHNTTVIVCDNVNVNDKVLYDGPVAQSTLRKSVLPYLQDNDESVDDPFSVPYLKRSCENIYSSIEDLSESTEDFNDKLLEALEPKVSFEYEDVFESQIESRNICKVYGSRDILTDSSDCIFDDEEKMKSSQTYFDSDGEYRKPFPVVINRRRVENSEETDSTPELDRPRYRRPDRVRKRKLVKSWTKSLTQEAGVCDSESVQDEYIVGDKASDKLFTQKRKAYNNVMLDESTDSAIDVATYSSDMGMSDRTDDSSLKYKGTMI